MCNLQDDAVYREHVNALACYMEGGWPSVTELGMLKRRLVLMRGKLEMSKKFLNCVLPWASDPELAIFDPLQPMLCAVSNTEDEKIELFKSFFLYDLIVVYITKGPEEKMKFKNFVEEALVVVNKSQMDAELTEALTTLLVGVMDTLRALHATLESKLTTSVLKGRVIKAVKKMSEEAKNQEKKPCSPSAVVRS